MTSRSANRSPVIDHRSTKPESDYGRPLSAHKIANLECMSEMCCTRLAKNTGRKMAQKNHRVRTIAQICRAISSQLRHVLTIRKKDLLNSNISSTRPHNMVNFCPLTPEIGSGVWGSPANLNGFRVSSVSLHGTLVVVVSQTLRR